MGRGIKIVDSQFDCAAYNLPHRWVVAADQKSANAAAAESELGNIQSGPAQRIVLHDATPAMKSFK